ncbi:cutinase family protein [Gordonia rhizosphera]|uniref:Cutinase n=1 Tax=Gordonia rhizosphera NBRC 16068 TaxID=1108045 RepID=K6UXL1_9ACTN|nr:cutinase family protein [Gordonia rhizosphera]GAB88133.1 hypothetical protein GORHZ_006_00020 [Gordonia rhizosphera NBRC 16068]
MIRFRVVPAAGAAVMSVVVVAGLAVAPGTASAAPVCAPLYVVGVPGTGETSPTGSTDLSSGMLGAITRPLASLAGSLTKDVAVPYDAGFGGAVGGELPYAQSVAQGDTRLAATLTQIAHRCSTAQFALAGYSQGAQVVSMVAKKIGEGAGPIDASRVAGVALLGNPVRQAGAPTFAGGSDRPESPPGGGSGSLANIPAFRAPTAAGGGIGPTADTVGGYGQLDGRVGDFCTPGDLACDAPSNSPLVHLVTNLAGSSTLDQKDPVGTLASIATALGSTAIKAGVDVVNEDVSGDTVDSLSYTPSVPLSQRLATASDPRTPMPGISDAVTALLKVGTIGFNAVATVVQTVFTPDTIAQMAAVGLANPAAALGVLAAKIPAAVVALVPPSTVSRWADEAFEAVKTEVTANSDLLDLTNLVSYWNAGTTHQSYGRASVSAATPSPALYIAQWFAALAHDAAGQYSFRPYRADGILNYDTSSGVSESSVFSPSVPPLSTAPTSPTSSPPLDPGSVGDGSSWVPSGGITAGAPTTPAPTPTADPSTTTSSASN